MKLLCVCAVVLGLCAPIVNGYEAKVLFSFEGGDKGKYELEDWPEEFKGKSSLAVVEEHAAAGKKALKLESRAPAGCAVFSGFDSDWSKYDAWAFDVFNPSDKPVPVSGWVRATDANANWWDRHNWDTILKPGANTVRLPVGGMTSPKANKPIDVTKVLRFNIAADHATLFIANIRLTKGLENEIPVAGIKKFSFGPAVSAIMPGFEGVCKDTLYNKERGYGWLPGGNFFRDFDIMEILGRIRPYDDLSRHLSAPYKASFVIDVPNGAYGGWLLFAPHGSGWGWGYSRRTVSANGKVLVEDIYDDKRGGEDAFRFQDEEDLPGEDLWDKYIKVMYRPYQFRFETEAVAGQLKLDFDGYGSRAMVCGLALWPQAGEKDAEKWLAALEALRKQQYQALHVEKNPEPQPYAASGEDRRRGYALFTHLPDHELVLNTVPTPEETRQTALALAGSPGEYVSGCVSLYLLKDCGEIKRAECSVNGKTVIPGTVRVVRFKAMNKTATYEVAPKYLDDVSSKLVPMKAGITRSFWTTFQIPADAEAGEFSGTLILSGAQGGDITIPVKLDVWPIKLAEPKFPMGMFMMGPHNGDWKQLLEDARAHGLTSLDPGISITLKRIVNGKAEVDFKDADRFMELAKAAGFTEELAGYSVGSGLDLRVQADYEKEAKCWNVSGYAEAVKAYFDAVREHAQEKGWLPIAFCTDDEYVIHPGGDPARLASHHKLLQENALGFHFVPFDSAYYQIPQEKYAEQDKMLAEIDTFAAGAHNQRTAEMVKKAGRRMWLYNTGMDRFTFGLYMFFARQKFDVKGFFEWSYNSAGFYLASFNEAHYGVVYGSSHGLRATPAWERIRLGCNDHRYFETAWQLIEKAKADNKAPAEAKTLQDLLESAMSKLRFERSQEVAADVRPEDNPRTPANLEKLRRAVAEGIIKLHKAAGY